MAIDVIDTKVKLSDLLLDPDNYRVAKDTVEKQSSLEEIHSEQKSILSSLKKQKLEDLKDSILKNGFLTVDRIVIKRLKDNKYLVIEGNRRVAALKSLIEDYSKGYIEDLNFRNVINKSRAISAVLVQGNEDEIKAYSNALMGIRHVSGAKKWHGWQSAKLVNRMYENGDSLTEIGLKLGITSIDAGRRMRGYKAYQQLENDDVYGSKKETHHYGLLLEFLSSNRKGKQWLGWDDSEFCFKNRTELNRVYQAITKNIEGRYEVRNTGDAREFLKRIENSVGQQRILQVENFRDIKLEDIKEDHCILSTIIEMLKSNFDLSESFDEDEIIKINEIKSIVDKMLGGGNE